MYPKVNLVYINTHAHTHFVIAIIKIQNPTSCKITYAHSLDLYSRNKLSLYLQSCLSISLLTPVSPSAAITSISKNLLQKENKKHCMHLCTFLLISTLYEEQICSPKRQISKPQFSIKINSTIAQKDQYFIPLTLKNIILMKNKQRPFYLMIYGKSWHVPLGS